MFAKVESWWRRLRFRLSRNEWAIRHLGITPSSGTGEEPGLLLIQIDGLARGQLERAIAAGRMPFLRRLLRREHYSLHSFYPGQPSTTPAVQAELYYGVRAAVPSFSFYDRVKREHGLMCFPQWAKDVESVCAAQGEGLLAGGSCWSNIYTGGAGQEESHFCGASLGFGDMWRTGKIRNIFVFILLNLWSVAKIAAFLVVELLLACWDGIAGIVRGERFGLELQMAVSRVFVGIGLRELITIGAAVDVTRGLPAVHVNFVGYDEQAHRRGPGSAFAHWSLRGIDRCIHRLARAAHASPRRDYAVWIFSDHGQERTQSFALKFPGGIEKIVHDCLESSQKLDPAWRPRSQRRPLPWMLRRKPLRPPRPQPALSPTEQATFTVAAMGPVGHVYFNDPLDDTKRQALARRLVADGKVPGVLLRLEPGTVIWFFADRALVVPGEEAAALLPHPPAVAAAITEDLAALAHNPNSGDLIVLGWSPGTPTWSFAPERGAHGGCGPEETRGFVLLPPRTRLPAGSSHFIRPAALRAAALHLLGRSQLAAVHPPVSGEVVHLRVMTYNTHGCAGVDGRVSPRRIARVIAAQDPDLVALQELDLGRRRSRAEDQSAIIARELEYHHVFCPTVTANEEHYGHAIFSRWPIEVVRRAFLPAAPGSWFPEPRSALWARVQVGVTRINFFTTHLGLGIEERRLQVQALLGPEWIGAVPAGEEIILCGDFNCPPGSVPYKLAAAQLRDAQRGVEGHRPLATFSSLQPFARIDHIFVSAGLTPRQIAVPRNGVTRVASDHLPLLAELATGPATAEKPSPRPA